MSKQEEDFWNSSSHSGFSFDDMEEDQTSEFSEDVVFHSSAEENAELPLHTVISKNCLALVLEDIKSTIDILAPPVEETIKKMMHGHKYTLTFYTKFRDKKDLLDKALETCNGNIIIKVIVFLKNTLTPNIFYQQLVQRKIAAKHFGYYLMISHKFDELADLYMATGNTLNIKEIFYLTGQGINNKELLYKKLDLFKVQHLQTVNSNEERWEINEHMDFIKFQIERKCHASSVIEQLADLCRIEISSNSYLERLQDFKKLFKIDDFTFDWILLNVMASMKLWEHLNDIFIKLNWLTKKNILKTGLSPEVLLNGLFRHNAPKETLEQFLACISDSDRALHLALKFQCHNFVILHYARERDRLALIRYREKILPKTTEYYLIESSLQSTEKKWKN